MGSQWPRLHREGIKAGMWSLAPLLLKAPGDREQQPSDPIPVDTQWQPLVRPEGLQLLGECHFLEVEDRFLVSLGMRYVSFHRSLELTVCPVILRILQGWAEPSRPSPELLKLSLGGRD